LLTGPVAATQAAIERLNHEIASASDLNVMREYQRALSIRQDQLAAVTRVAAEHARMLASLQFIVGTIEAFPAWIFRLRVLDRRAKKDGVREVYEEMDQMKIERTASQHLLEGLVQSAGES